MSNKHEESVDAMVDILKDALVEVVSALTVREQLKERLEQASNRQPEPVLSSRPTPSPAEANPALSHTTELETKPDSVRGTENEREEALTQLVSRADVDVTEPVMTPPGSAIDNKSEAPAQPAREDISSISATTPLPPAMGTATDELRWVDGVDENRPLSEGESRFFEMIDTDPSEMQEYEPHDPEYLPEKLPSIGMHKTLWQVIILFAAMLIFVNVPIIPPGIAIARVISDTKSLIVREGLIFKSATQDEIYVLDENLQKRWIADIAAFEFYNITWDQVSIADDAFVAQFKEGEPVYVLVKCGTSPHVFALEAGKKRWIKDISTFNEQGFVWEQIDLISCSRLDRIPDGLPIPEDAGRPEDRDG